MLRSACLQLLLEEEPSTFHGLYQPPLDTLALYWGIVGFCFLFCDHNLPWGHNSSLFMERCFDPLLSRAEWREKNPRCLVPRAVSSGTPHVHPCPALGLLQWRWQLVSWARKPKRRALLVCGMACPLCLLPRERPQRLRAQFILGWRLPVLGCVYSKWGQPHSELSQVVLCQWSL